MLLPATTGARQTSAMDLPCPSPFDPLRAELQRTYPGVSDCGQCYQRACGLLGHMDVPAHRKLVVNVMFDGVFEDGGKGYDCQHVVAVLRPGYTMGHFPPGTLLPDYAIEQVVDPDRFGTDGVDLASYQSLYGGLGIRTINAGSRVDLTG